MVSLQFGNHQVPKGGVPFKKNGWVMSKQRHPKVPCNVVDQEALRCRLAEAGLGCSSTIGSGAMLLSSGASGST